MPDRIQQLPVNVLAINTDININIDINIDSRLGG
jgi:hypothetical protein